MATPDLPGHIRRTLNRVARSNTVRDELETLVAMTPGRAATRIGRFDHESTALLLTAAVNGAWRTYPIPSELPDDPDQARAEEADRIRTTMAEILTRHPEVITPVMLAAIEARKARDPRRGPGRAGP